MKVLVSDGSERSKGFLLLMEEEIKLIELPTDACSFPVSEETQSRIVFVSFDQLDSSKLKIAKRYGDSAQIIAFDVPSLAEAGKLLNEGITGCLFAKDEADSEAAKLVLKSVEQEACLLDCDRISPRYIVLTRKQREKFQRWNAWLVHEIITLWRMRVPNGAPTIDEVLQLLSLKKVDALVTQSMNGNRQSLVEEVEGIIQNYRQGDLSAEKIEECEKSLASWFKVYSPITRESAPGCMQRIGINANKISEKLRTEAERLVGQSTFGPFSRVTWLAKLIEALDAIAQELLEAQEIEQRRIASASSSYRNLVTEYRNSLYQKDPSSAINALSLIYRSNIKMSGIDSIRQLVQSLSYKFSQDSYCSRRSDSFLYSLQQELETPFLGEDMLFAAWQQYLQKEGSEIALTLQTYFERWSQTNLHNWGEKSASSPAFGAALTEKLLEKVSPHTLKVYCQFLKYFYY